MSKSTYKGFIKNINGDYILPITRAELVLDASGMPAFNSSAFVAEASTNGEGGRYGLVSPATLELINSLTTGTDGGSLGDIYANISILNTKLNHINSGLSVGDSILNFYRKAIKLRKELSCVKYGNYIEYNKSSSKLYVYTREDDKQKILVVCSYSEGMEEIKAPAGFDLDKAELILNNYDSMATSVLKPYETRVYLMNK